MESRHRYRDLGQCRLESDPAEVPISQRSAKLSGQSGADKPSDNEGYAGGSETERKLSTPGAPNGHPGKDRDRGADGEQAEHR